MGKEKTSTKGARKLDIHTEKNKCVTLYHTITEKSIQKGLNTLRPKIVKLLEENIEKSFHDIGLGNDILHKTAKTQARKAKISK